MMNPLNVGVATTEEQHAALALVFSDQPEPTQRAMIRSAFRTARQGGHGLGGVLVARRETDLVGACWVQVLPGRVGLLWRPLVVEGEPPDTQVQLLQAADDYLVAHEVRLSQVLSDPDGDRELLEAAGYDHSTLLSYLVCPLQSLPQEQPTSELKFEPFREGDQGRLEDIVERTYEGTLDCPELNGVRGLSDVLAGYRSVGEFHPDRWLIVQHSGQDVGCLFLADHANDEQWELVYMGLVPEARGCGWGEQIARHAAWLTQAAGRKQIMLAVDAANEHAQRSYRRVNFDLVTQRRVYLKIFS